MPRGTCAAAIFGLLSCLLLASSALAQPMPMGACCTYSFDENTNTSHFCCQVKVQNECYGNSPALLPCAGFQLVNGVRYQGDNTTCVSPCPWGACYYQYVIPDTSSDWGYIIHLCSLNLTPQECADLSWLVPPDATNASSVYLGHESQPIFGPNALDIGSCCNPNGCGGYVKQGDCAGAWDREQTCSICFGACCRSDGCCTVVTQANCQGSWLGGTNSCFWCYCGAYAESCGGGNEFISRVTFNTIDNPSQCNPSGSAGLNQCTSDFLHISTNIAQGHAYPITVYNGAPNAASQCAVWFDWDRSGVLSSNPTAGEMYTLTSADDGATFTGSVAVPSTAMLGCTRMRICLLRGATPFACNANTHGEYEDYTVNVQPGLCPAGSDDCENNEWISYVKLQSTNGLAENDSTHDAGCYSNFASRTPVVVCPGNDCTLTAQIIFVHSSTQVGAWFDWNQNGDFTDSGEQVTLTPSQSFPSVFSAEVSVPGNARLGETTVRVRAIRASLGDTLAPCGITTVGEVEDYKVQVGLTHGICCSEDGCCTCLFTHTVLPGECSAPNKFLPCDISCEPNPCPSPPALHAILVGGGGTMISDPLANPRLIETALNDIDGVNPGFIHVCSNQVQIATAAGNVRRDIKPQDTLLFFIAGHGGFCKPGEEDCDTRLNESPVFMLGAQEATECHVSTNGGTNFVSLGNFYGGASSRYYATELAQDLQFISAGRSFRKIVVIDSCFSGGFRRNLDLSSGANTSFVPSSGGGRFSVIQSGSLGKLTVSLRDALGAAPATNGMPPFDAIVSALRAAYPGTCPGTNCFHGIPVPTAERDIVVDDPEFSIAPETSPDFDGTTPLSSPVPWCGPSLSSHPADARACPGAPSTFTVTHAPATYTYQWQLAGVPLIDQPGHIAGATTATLTITGATAADAGAYECVLGNACGTLTSATATLTVCLADFDCSGTLAVADIFAFLNAWFSGSPAADVNGGGLAVSDIFTFLNTWFAGCP